MSLDDIVPMEATKEYDDSPCEDKKTWLISIAAVLLMLVGSWRVLAQSSADTSACDVNSASFSASCKVGPWRLRFICPGQGRPNQSFKLLLILAV